MKILKRMIFIFVMSVFFLFFLSSASQGQGLKFGLKFTGGMNYQLFGDGDAILKAQKAASEDFINKYSGYTIDNPLIPLFSHFGLDFEADAILYLSPQFGLSLGTGYIQAGTIFGSDDSIITSSVSRETGSYDIKASATPIKVGIYYNFSSIFSPKGKSSSYLYAGIGFYSAKYSVLEKWNFVNGSQSDWSTYEEKSKAKGIGFHGGLGAESWLGPNFALIFEIFGRYANIGGFKGDWQSNSKGGMSSGSGTLYFFEWMDSRFGSWYPGTHVLSSSPSGPNVRNVREAKINFSGVGIRLGMKINF